MIRHRVVENTFARAYPPADGEGGGIGDGAYGRPYFREDSAAAAPKVSDQSLRERARLLDTVRIVDQLKELGTLDPGQLRDLSRWLRPAGDRIQPNEFWQGLQGSGFNPFGEPGLPKQLGGPGERGARNGGGGYDWRSPTGGPRDPRVEFGVGRWGPVSDGGGHEDDEPDPDPVDDTPKPLPLVGQNPRQTEDPDAHMRRWIEKMENQRREEASRAGEPETPEEREAREFGEAVEDYIEDFEREFGRRMRGAPAPDAGPPPRRGAPDPGPDSDSWYDWFRRAYRLGPQGSPGLSWRPLAPNPGPRVRPIDGSERGPTRQLGRIPLADEPETLSGGRSTVASLPWWVGGDPRRP